MGCYTFQPIGRDGAVRPAVRQELPDDMAALQYVRRYLDDVGLALVNVWEGERLVAECSWGPRHDNDNDNLIDRRES